ncbi:bifunctional D-glycero-beta-D-manno-heptose-7-phosphate kinase/D-glycero-beta-D-manno-heptose 1-phosphate adenylyltransferase HldE [soil metagenome]
MQFHIPAFNEAHVLVVGDVMLDRYWHGDTQRISPEAPVPVVRIEQIEERLGGAANVALNIHALGAKVELCGLVGNDSVATILEDKLAATGINYRFHRIENKATITKLRVLSLHQQLIRLDFDNIFSEMDATPLWQSCTQQLNAIGALVISDYGKGSVAQPQSLIQAARLAGVPVLVDPKGTDFSRYRGATILTPNRKEFEAIVGPCNNEHDFVEKGARLIDELNLQALLITRGAQGVTLLRKNMPELHLPTKAREIYDVTGAGDTVIATLAAAVAAGEDLAFATLLANRAAGIVVRKLGTATVNLAELRRALSEDTASGKGVMTEDQLAIVIEDAKAHGERLVMTNGCFDILHAGHIAYLQQAKNLGDRLIVAVNDDASVVRLKGSGRPINNLQQRMAVLAGLGAVDWVVPFSEDTPERLICRLLPHVLVKGGDYRPEDIAGGECVKAQGGEVQVLNFEEGCSTTNMIERIMQLTTDAV